VKIKHMNPNMADWAEWQEDEHGDHIPLPLDPAQFDAAAVDEAVVALREAQGFHLTPWSDLRESDREEWRRELRAALAAYARTVAGGGND
jgi:hypothetical protein